MKKIIPIFSFLVILVFSFSLIFSSSESLCYDSTNGEVDLKSFCDTSEIKLKNTGYEIVNFYVFDDEYNRDSTFELDNRKICKLIGYEIYLDKVNGKKIYEEIVNFESDIVDQTLDILGEEVLLEEICEVLDYDLETYQKVSEDYEVDSTTLNDILEGSSDEDDSGYDGTISKEEVEYCRGRSGQLGFFSQKEICEYKEENSLSGCIYNPITYNFFSYDKDVVDENTDIVENSKITDSCIPRERILSCFDYKSEDACNDNLAEIESCKWVESDVYSEDKFNYKRGVCAPKNNFDDRFSDNFFNEDNFYENLNTFELNPANTYLYDLNDNLVFNLSNGKINKTITNLKSETDYGLSFFFKTEDKTSKIEIEVLDSFENTLFDEVIEVNANVFTKYIKNINIENSNKISILISSTDDVLIDDLNFVLYSSLFKEDENYFPFFLINNKTTNCEVCFDKFGFNLCTKLKNDLIGSCSYMVENEGDNYIIENENSLRNKFTKDNGNFFSEKLTSKSITNSSVFCELYKTENSCLDQNNFVNLKFLPLNHFATNSLCSWDNNLGCYKDSNSDNNLDFVYQNEILTYTSFDDCIDNDCFSQNYPHHLGCDLTPPKSNIFFKSLNTNLDDLNITESTNISFGSSNLSILINDFVNPICYEFEEFETNLNLVLKSDNENYTFFFEDKNVLFEKNLGEIFFKDFENLEIYSFDRSGNIGKKFYYNFENIDIFGPEVNILNKEYDEISTGTYYYIKNPIFSSLDLNFNFSISDENLVESCDYNLYRKEDNTLIENLNYNFDSSLNYLMISPNIFETTSSGDMFQIELTCYDIFNQFKTTYFDFFLDISSDVKLVYPTSNRDDSVDGYLNSDTELYLVSDDPQINSCEIVFEDTSDFLGDKDLTIVNDVNGFTPFEDSSYIAYTKINGLLSFEDEGVKNGVLNCLTIQGQESSRDLIFIYEEGIEVLGFSFFANPTYNIGNDYYTYNDNVVEFEFEINSLSPVSNIEVTPIKDDGSTGMGDYDFNLNYTGASTIVELFIEKSNLYFGKYIDDGFNKGLYNVSYDILITTKSNNSLVKRLHYYHDTNNPKQNIKFGDEIFDRQIGEETILFTNKDLPNINIDFNIPKYRTYTCSVEFESEDGNTYKKDLIQNSNNVSFKITDLSVSIKSVHRGEIGVNNCIDVYGLDDLKISSLKIEKDDVLLEMISLGLKGGNDIIFKTGDGIILDELFDSIGFEFKDTNEKYISCDYKFRSTDTSEYRCSTDVMQIEKSDENFAPSLFYTNEKKILGNYDSEDFNCIRSDDPYKFYDENSGLIQTNLKLEAVCVDASNQKVSKTQDIKISYTDGIIGFFDFVYEDSFAFPTVKTLGAAKKVIISSSQNEDDILFELDLVDENTITKTYTYSTDTGINLGDYSSYENVKIYTIVYLDDDTTETAAEDLVLDFESPQIEILVLDEVDNVVYSNSTIIDVYAFEEESSIEEVEVFVLDKKIFSLNDFLENETNFDENFISKVITSEYIDDENKKYELSFEFFGLINQIYPITFVAYDSVRNEIETQKEIEFKDGVGIFLIDSDNAKLESSKSTLLTQVLNPIINFELTKDEVSNCVVLGDDRTITLFKNQGIFTFNFEDLTNKDLKEIEKYSFNISCNYLGVDYKVQRDLRFSDTLPDYVLYIDSLFFNKNEMKKLKVKSVGIEKDINCRYIIEDETYEFDNGKVFSNYATQNYLIETSNNFNLSLVCENILGKNGAVKTYEFKPFGEFIINEKYFLDYNLNKLNMAENNEFLVDLDKNYDFVFTTKVKANNCYYTISNTDIVSRFIEFTKGLFSESGDLIDEAKAFEYIIKDLSFKENKILQITCDGYSEDFEILTQDKNIDIEISTRFYDTK